MEGRFLDSVLGKMGLIRKAAIGPLPADRVIYKSLREMLGEQGSVVAKPYEQSVWVYAAINAIATNIARVPFVIRRDIGAGLSKKIEEGPIYELFLNPNPLMSQRQLIEASMIFLSLFGECMWVFEGRDDITKLPKEIWTFNPNRFEPVQNAQGMVVGWLYDNGNGNKIPLANHEVLFFKYFNPYDDIRGLAPIKAAQESVNQDFYASRYNSAFFKNSATVSGFISVEGELTDEQFNRTLKQFEDRHQGYEKAHKIALLEGGGTFQPSTITQKDMEYIQGKNMTKQEILAAYKVNEVILGNFDSVKCFHPDTEVFTDKGFVSVKDIKVGDKVASLNPVIERARFESVTSVYAYDYNGPMYKQSGKWNTISFCVTPDHKMLTHNVNHRRDDYRLTPIKDIPFYKIKNKCLSVPIVANWGERTNKGKDLTFDVQRREFERKKYRNGSKNGFKETEFPVVSFLKFLGWFIAEGNYFIKSHFELGITQTKPEGRKAFLKDMKEFPYKITEYKKVFKVSGKDLYTYLMENVGHYCYEKRVPREILDLHPSLLRHLFDALIAGDGCVSKTGQTVFSTTSRQLADDFSEIAIKLGYAPVLGGGRPGQYKTKDGKIKKCRIVWSVSFSEIEKKHRGRLNSVKIIPYKGKVHCFEVPPNHTVLIRYEGRVMWIGQSYDGIKAADKAFWEETLMPKTHYLEDHLWAKFFSNIGQRRGKGKIWGEFDLATVGSLQVNYDDKIVTAAKMFTMGWPINAINRRLELGMEDVAWGDMWFVPGGYLPVNMLGKVKPGLPEPPEPDDDSDDDTKKLELEKPASSFYELEFRNKIKKFTFEIRKKVLSSLYEDEFVRPDVKREFDKLMSDLQKVYALTINESYSSCSMQVAEEKKIDNSSPEVVTYVSTRIGILTEGFAGLIEDLFDVLEKSTCDKEGKAEKVRIVFNAITQKSLVLARKESAQAADFGRSLFVQGTFGPTIGYLKEE